MEESFGTCGAADHATLPRPVGEAVAARLDRAARLFRTLGDGPRLRLLTILAGGERCVTELALLEGEHLSTMSQRLRLLRSENLVAHRRRGKHVLYTLADGHVAAIVAAALTHAGEPAAPQPGTPIGSDRQAEGELR